MIVYTRGFFMLDGPFDMFVFKFSVGPALAIHINPPVSNMLLNDGQFPNGACAKKEIKISVMTEACVKATTGIFDRLSSHHDAW